MFTPHTFGQYNSVYTRFPRECFSTRITDFFQNLLKHKFDAVIVPACLQSVNKSYLREYTRCESGREGYSQQYRNL